jgi:16S rRNA (cytosine967-C5)-methyltransferase
MAARVSPARMAAFRVLLHMERSSNAHCDELLRAPAMEALSPADRNLTTALVMGVLRWQLALDAIAARYLRRESALDDAVAIALRLGVFQLLGMERIPPHAALSESVELAKASGHSHASGMVNAVLRRVAEAASTLQLDPAAAHPAWLLTRWTKHFGAEASAGITSYDQQPPTAALRVSQSVPEEGSLLPGALLNNARRVPEGTAVPDGFRIQDEGSQLVAELAGKGSRILDCCAAPGGKTAILASNNPKSEITACDISEARLSAMRRNFAKDPVTAGVHCLLADATALPFRDDFDLILCDAPCSGTGTLARNPEIKLRLAPSELVRQQQRQLAIVRSAFRVLAPGGRLVYATCSLEPEENVSVVEAFLNEEPAANRLLIEERVSAMQQEGTLHDRGAELLRRNGVRDGYLQTLPGLVPCDGFFAAVLTRT